MTTAVQYAVLGVGTGAIYALLAQGVVFIQWGTGVINLSSAATGMFAAYLFWDMSVGRSWPLPLTLALAAGWGALYGVLVYWLVMRPLRNATALARVVATLGLLLLLQGLAQVFWGVLPKFQPSFLPSHVFQIHGVYAPLDRFILMGIAVAITFGLWAMSRFTPLGLAIRAGAESPRSVASLGWSPDALATLTWAIGSCLAAIAGILIAPLAGLSTDELPLLIIPVLAAALIGGFKSFWLTLVGATAIGIAQGEFARYVHIVGINWAVPLIVIVILLAIRGKGLPTREDVLESRLPEVGTGRVRPFVVGPLVVLMACLTLFVFPDHGGARLLDALTLTFAWAIIMLSVIVLLGYTSQLSFEQMAMAGLAALVAGRLVSSAHWPFEAAFVVAVMVSVPIGVLFALPALRTRGVSLAIVTLALGMVVFQTIFQNVSYTGGSDGTPVGPQSFFGISIDAIKYPDRYALFVLIFFVICAVVVANVRRSSYGRRLLAVRTNERAAAALGISVFRAKLFAFIIGSSMAAVGGILLAFQQPLIDYSAFNPFNSIVVVTFCVIGGIGFVGGGSSFAAAGAPGAIGAWLFLVVFPNANPIWIVVAGGIFVVVLVVLHPDGAVSLQIKQGQQIATRWRTARGKSTRRRDAPPPLRLERVAPASLEISRLVVRYGGVTAVDDVTLKVKAGEIVGLIGPNGAGKTSLIDAVTAFAPAASGEVRLNGQRIDTWSAHRRARAGLGRSFQSLELFEQSTVLENLQVASDLHTGSHFGELARPRADRLSPAAIAAVHELGLADEIDQRVSDLSYGHRRLVAIARALALEPSLLLIDEPAAGLSEAECAHLLAVLRRLVEESGFGILVVEHDMHFVMAACDRLVVMDFGSKIAEGTPADVRANPHVIAAYLGEPETDTAAT